MVNPRSDQHAVSLATYGPFAQLGYWVCVVSWIMKILFNWNAAVYTAVVHISALLVDESV